MKFAAQGRITYSAGRATARAGRRPLRSARAVALLPVFPAASAVQAQPTACTQIGCGPPVSLLVLDKIPKRMVGGTIRACATA